MFLIVHGAVRNLPISPGSRQYQVWVLHDDDEGWYYWSHYRILHLEVSDSFPFFSQAESYPSSLPGAIAIFLLSLGISRVPSTLPAPVYALLSGLNAAAVGVILLAGVQLARKAITDKLTLPLVLFTACAGICYNALWYFPVLMMTCGIVCWVWELWMKEWVRSGRDWLSSKKWRRRRNATGSGAAVAEEEERHRDMDIELDISNVGVAPPMSKDGESTSSRRSVKAEGSGTSNAPAAAAPDVGPPPSSDKGKTASSADVEESLQPKTKALSPRAGIILICGFFGQFFVFTLYLSCILTFTCSFFHYHHGPERNIEEPIPRTATIQKYVSRRNDHFRWRTGTSFIFFLHHLGLTTIRWLSLF